MVRPISIVLTKYESYKMTQIYNEESNNKGGIHEPLNRSEFLRGPRTDDKVKTSKGGRRDGRIGPIFEE